jgi:hypothetical protein
LPNSAPRPETKSVVAGFNDVGTKTLAALIERELQSGKWNPYAVYEHEEVVVGQSMIHG